MNMSTVEEIFDQKCRGCEDALEIKHIDERTAKLVCSKCELDYYFRKKTSFGYQGLIRRWRLVKVSKKEEEKKEENKKGKR